MTQPHLLEQAKQGDAQAIAALMNKSLQPKGMTAYVERQGDHLEVVLKSDRIPNRQALTTFVEQGIQNLGVEAIRSVTISGQQIGATTSAWTERLDLAPLIPSFEPDATFDSSFDESNFAGSAMASMHGSESSDLSQLHDLLSDQSETSFADPQRQELENRLESLWVEQSEQSQDDFLSELMAEEPQDATRQFEAFLAEQPDDQFRDDQFQNNQFQDDRFQSMEQEGLWNSSPSLESEDILADLNLEDSRQALTHQLHETPYDWQNAAQGTDEEPNDEPDEILFGFMDDQPQPPEDLGLDEAGEPIDEPDEILVDFFQGSSASAPENPLDDSAASTDEALLDLLAESDDSQEQSLLWELTDDQQPASLPIDTTINAEENTSETPGEFSFNSSPDLMNELSLGVEEEPNSSNFDFSATESSDASADAAFQSWEHPPIEFLQADLEPMPPEMPTEQFDEPLVDLTMEPSSSDPDRPADFPPDFLQESPADQSDDLFVESQTNPFIEQMEEQDRDRLPKPEGSPNEDSAQFEQNQQFDQFDQSEWLLDDVNESNPNEPPYAAQFQGINDAQLDSTPSDNTQLDESDLLSEEALIDFFETESTSESPTSEFSDSQFADSGFTGSQFAEDETNFSDYRTRPDNPDADFDLSLDSDRPAEGGTYADSYVDPYATPYPEDSYVANPPRSEVVEAPSDSRGSPWLFPLILLGISGWIVGLISFAFLWSRLSSPPTETAETSPSEVVASPTVAPTACPPATEATGNAPIAFSELQFQQNASNPQQINLMGCLTNRTQQPVDIVSIGYRSGTANSSTVGGLNLSNGVIQPGQTVPFTSKFTLPSDTTDVAIDTVYWQPAGQSTSREASTSVNLSR